MAKSKTNKEKIYKQALINIINPIAYLQKEAQKNKTQLDGFYAIQLTKSPSFYQDIARKALIESEAE